MSEQFTKEELRELLELLEYATLDDIQAGNKSFDWCQNWYCRLDSMYQKIESLLE